MKRLLLTGTVFLGTILTGCAGGGYYASARIGPPPPPRYGVMGYAPGPGYVWTDGYWDFGPGCQRKWNEIQNTSKDVQLLANYLLLQYKSLVWNKVDVRKPPQSARQQALDLNSAS